MSHNIAQRIKQRRKDLAMSQDDLAKACSVGQSTVANWESGSHIPRQASLTRIALALNTDDVWLLSGEHAKARSSLNAYLQKPIHHVPIFEWPQKGQFLENAQPHSYFPISSGYEDVFAILLKINMDKFKAGTILVFSRNKTDGPKSYFLSNSSRGYSIARHVSEDTIGRLLYSIERH